MMNRRWIVDGCADALPYQAEAKAGRALGTLSLTLHPEQGPLCPITGDFCMASPLLLQSVSLAPPPFPHTPPFPGLSPPHLPLWPLSTAPWPQVPSAAPTRQALGSAQSSGLLGQPATTHRATQDPLPHHPHPVTPASLSPPGRSPTGSRHPTPCCSHALPTRPPRKCSLNP